MRTLTSNELTRQRTEAESILVDSCTIQVASKVADGQGGETITWPNTYTNVVCKLYPASGNSDQSEGDKFAISEGWGLRVKQAQHISSGNRVVIDGDTFEVIRVEDDHTWRTVRRAALRRVG